jgi:hypothetical protein
MAALNPGQERVARVSRKRLVSPVGFLLVRPADGDQMRRNLDQETWTETRPPTLSNSAWMPRKT